MLLDGSDSCKRRAKGVLLGKHRRRQLCVRGIRIFGVPEATAPLTPQEVSASFLPQTIQGK